MAATDEDRFLDSELRRVDAEATFSDRLAREIAQRQIKSAQNHVPRTQPFSEINEQTIAMLANGIDPKWDPGGMNSTYLFRYIRSGLPGIFNELNDMEKAKLLEGERLSEIISRMSEVIANYLADKRLNPGKFPSPASKPEAFAEFRRVASLRPEELSHKQIVDRATKAVMTYSDTRGLGPRALQSALNIQASKGGGKINLDPKVVEANANLLLERTEIPEKWRLTLARERLYGGDTSYPRKPNRYARPKKT